MTSRAFVAIALACAIAGCDRGARGRPAVVEPPPAPRAATNAVDPTPASASSAGVADDADATPAELSDPATYGLPGLLSSATTETWLRQRFGDANVRVADVPGGEGETSRGVILFPEDAARRAYLYFQDTESLRGLSLVRVFDAGSRWRLEENGIGIGIGMPLSKLVATNGRPLRFSGFDWDYGGAISDWNGGRLQPGDTDARRPVIRLGHGEAPDGAYPMGDAVFASDDPRYPRLGDIAFVSEIGVSFPGEDDL